MKLCFWGVFDKYHFLIFLNLDLTWDKWDLN